MVTVGDPMMIVLEYMEHGSMQTYLKKFDINASQKKRFALVLMNANRFGVYQFMCFLRLLFSF